MDRYVVYCGQHRNGVTGPYETKAAALLEAFDQGTAAHTAGERCYFHVMPLFLLDGWTLTKIDNERGRGQYL